jgi:hypothetical protein
MALSSTKSTRRLRLLGLVVAIVLFFQHLPTQRMEGMGYAETWCRIACLKCISLWFPCSPPECTGYRSTRS